MPVVPVSVIEPFWAQFSALLREHPRSRPLTPLRCNRRRIADRIVVDQVIAALVHDSGYERIAEAGCSDRTIRRRLHEWSRLGLADILHRLVLEHYDRLIGLELDDLVVDGCITKALSGGEMAGRSPVDRGNWG